MRQPVGHVATGAAAAAFVLALAACLGSQLVASAAATGAESAGMSPRRYGNSERLVDGASPRLDGHLLFLNGGNGDGDIVGVDQDDGGLDKDGDDEQEDEYGPHFDEIKRKWGQQNLALWGKRRSPYVDREDDILATKRKWGQKNMALWGKRGSRVSDDIATEKRKWGQKNMALWGRK